MVETFTDTNEYVDDDTRYISNSLINIIIGDTFHIHIVSTV